MEAVGTTGANGIATESGMMAPGGATMSGSRFRSCSVASRLLQRRSTNRSSGVSPDSKGGWKGEKTGREAGGIVGDAGPHVDSEFTLDEDDLEEATGVELEVHEARLLDRATAAQTIAELERAALLFTDPPEETHNDQRGDREAFGLRTRARAHRHAQGGACPTRRPRGHGRVSRMAGEGSGTGCLPFSREGTRSRHEFQLLPLSLNQPVRKSRNADLE